MDELIKEIQRFIGVVEAPQYSAYHNKKIIKEEREVYFDSKKKIQTIIATLTTEQGIKE